MTRIRVSVVVLLLWLLLFYTVDWWSPEIKFTAAVDVLLPVVAIALLAVPVLQRAHVGLLLAALTAMLLGLKWLVRAPLWGPALPITMLEIFALGVVALLARYVSMGITTVEEAVVHMTVGQLGERRARIGEVYREIRRARLHHRPLTLLAVRHDGKSVNLALDRIVVEAQEAIVEHYLQASTARVLNEALDDYNIVARRGDHFLVILPETTPDELPDVMKRLRRAGLEQIGVGLQIGAASLPSDAATLEGLIAKATEDMQTDQTMAPGSAQSASAYVLSKVTVPEVNHVNVDGQ